MCAQKTLLKVTGFEKAVEQLLGMNGHSHTVSKNQYKGLDIIVGKNDVTGEKTATLITVFAEGTKPSLPNDEQLLLFKRFISETKRKPYVAQLALGTRGKLKDIQKIPLQEIAMD